MKGRRWPIEGLIKRCDNSAYCEPVFTVTEISSELFQIFLDLFQNLSCSDIWTLRLKNFQISFGILSIVYLLSFFLMPCR